MNCHSSTLSKSSHLWERPADKFLHRLDKVKRTGPGRWVARCPAHNDRTPSLAVREADDSRLLVHCFAGCPVDAVVRAVGLTLADLFPPPANPVEPRSPIKPSFYATDVLRLIHQEIFVVLAAACTALQQELTEDDIARLELAVERLTDALKLAGVRA